MNKIRRITTWLLLLCMVLTMVACGSGTKGADTVISNSSKPVEEKNDEDSAELTPEEIEAKKQFANSTPENDTDIGLKNIKIDTAERELTDVQKKIIQYFDEDYLHVEFYDFLRRYPDLFTNVQIDTYGGVSKLLEVGDKTYQFACGYSDEYGNPVYEMVVNCPINGTKGHTRFIEGDFLWIYGKLLGEQSFNIDGKSYVLPVIDAYYPTSIYEMGVVYKTNLYDLDYIKPIAESIFGDDIEIRQPTPEDGVQFEYSEWENYLAPNEATRRDLYFVVELNNQSNAKFNKYLFYRESGAIIDMRATENIERRIEFSADFQHFFLFTYDMSLEILTLEYYDHNLDRVWKREFLETTNAVYDFTKNNVYLIANNELYIININTGDDTYSPSYVGERMEIRKMKDGILLLSKNKSDAVVKTDLAGNMIWKTNLGADAGGYRVQLVNNHIVLYAMLDDEYSDHFIAIDSETGAVLADVISLEAVDYYYGG